MSRKSKSNIVNELIDMDCKEMECGGAPRRQSLMSTDSCRSPAGAAQKCATGRRPSLISNLFGDLDSPSSSNLRDRRDSRVTHDDELRSVTSRRCSLANDLMVDRNQNAQGLARKGNKMNTMYSETSNSVWTWPAFFHSNYNRAEVFERVYAFVIALNIATISVETELVMGDADRSELNLISTANLCFTILYAIELAVRICVLGLPIFAVHDANLLWNVFDICTITCSVINEILSRTLLGQFEEHGVLWILRFLNFANVFRIARITRAFRDARILLEGIKGSFRWLLMCMLLLVLGTLTFSLCIMQLLSDTHLSDDDETHVFVETEFRTIMSTSSTLLASVMGGLDWHSIWHPLSQIDAGIGLLFLGYVMMGMLCMLNIITGIYVEHASDIMHRNAEYIEMQDAENRSTAIRKLARILAPEHTGDATESTVSLKQFEERVSDYKVQAHLRKMDIVVDSGNAANVYKLIDLDGTGLVDLEDLITCLRNLSGGARQLTLARTEVRLKNLQMDVHELAEALAILHGFNAAKTPTCASPPCFDADGADDTTLPECTSIPVNNTTSVSVNL
eukprot:NODE_3401_length_2043_cov_13.786013.p1 GENE.NODE_3401_length_2043_cov_13.786013~~NODE_3401_length_2043_cov_13.786013.p1  ORF type:complete len:591 (-),score=72.16 NODE_3401_length_2043_cov_13.786013:271-1968(-)